MIRAARAALASALLCLAFACAPLSACGPEIPGYPGPAQALLGGGIYDFLQIPSCSRVPIIHGPQGGYHIWASLRARYLDFTGARVELSYTDADSGALFHRVALQFTDFYPVPESRLSVLADSLADGAPCADGGVPLEPAGSDAGGTSGNGRVPSSAVPGGIDGWGEALALTAFLPQQWTGCMVHACVAERRLRLRATVTDRNGRSASDERTLVPAQEPSEVSVYCSGDVDAGIVAVDLGGEKCL